MDNEKQTLTGTIVFLNANVGSKSDSVQPMLYRGKDETPLPLYSPGDNPFENTSLAQYDGQAVELTGMMERGKFVIEMILARIEK